MKQCPLTKHWCMMCGGDVFNPICYEGTEIRGIKGMKACPLIPLILQHTDENTSQLPS